MKIDAVVVCDASLRISNYSGEVIASVGGAVLIGGESLIDISLHLEGWRSSDITQIEYHALLTGLLVASQLNTRSLQLVGDNQQALDMIRAQIVNNDPSIPRELRRRLRCLESFTVVKAGKDDVRLAHDLANRASTVRLAEIDKQRSETLRTI